MKSYQQFFAELKRRNVFKVAAVYGAVGFGLIQIAEPLGAYLRLPDTFGPFIVALLLLGFPVALVLAWAFELSPQGVHRIEPAAPGEIEAIVAQPASKRWPAGLLAMAGLAALLAGAWWMGVKTGRSDAGALVGSESPDSLQFSFVDPGSDERPSISVLPFADMSPEGDQGYFSDGITEELYNVLGKIRELRVTGRTSAFAFKGRSLDLRDVGDSLDVGYLVEGSVRKDGDQLRITAQLIDTESGSHLWSDTYDRRMEDIFAIQSEIAEAIARELRVPLGLDSAEQLVSPTEDLAAYDLYLAGRDRMRRRGGDLEEAVDLFEAAIARDSNWAPAWAGLAESRSLLPFYVPGADSTFWAESLATAERAAERALALDPGNASAAVALGNVHRDRWEWEAAADAYSRALTLDPDNVEAHQQYAEYLGYVGRNAEAVRAALRALALDRAPIRLNVAGYLSRHAGAYDRARSLLDEGLAADPENNVPFLRKNRAYIAFKTETSPRGREWYLAWLAKADPELATRVEAAWPASEPLPTPEAAKVVSAKYSPRGAELWLVRDEPERALAALEDGLEGRLPFGEVNWLWQTLLEPLRQDPRFDAILAAWGFPEGRPES